MENHVQSEVIFLEKVAVACELAENCCGWSTGIVREPREMGTPAVGSRHQRTGEATADWEDLMRGLVNCRLCISLKSRCYLQLRVIILQLILIPVQSLAVASHTRSVTLNSAVVAFIQRLHDKCSASCKRQQREFHEGSVCAGIALNK
jgi:hypothetical protein